MNTKNYTKKGIVVTMIALLLGNSLLAQNTSQDFTSIKGKVIEIDSKRPINYANVYIENSNVGIVSNSEGGFILKVPADLKDKTIVFSCLGYKTNRMKLDQLSTKENIVVELSPESINLQELIIRTDDPIALIRAAVKNIPENYGLKPYDCTAFYREILMQNHKYAGIAEAILNIYKSQYTPFGNDRIRVFKGRKSEDVQKMDTILFKLKGGQHVAMLLDLAKTPASFMDELYLKDYSYKTVKTVSIEGRETYLIEFTQNPNIPEALYDGKIYLDIQTLAIVKAEFGFSPTGLEYANRILIDKKPMNTKVKTVEGNYAVDYRFNNGHWVLNHIHYDVKFKVDKKKQLFSKTYTTMVDLAITDRDTVNVNKYKASEMVKSNEIFIDNVSKYYDETFWGNYNIIKPEESIEDAVERINKKMMKQK